MFDNEEKRLMELSDKLNNTAKPDCINNFYILFSYDPHFAGVCILY
ncbi:hypothetical protein LGK97_09110 [Clostridium sp. CS001]|nr:hypothetical protein [Clostridium sp. CS001]MCB2289923.1 hypothetical protein [Clostridium sp. CS001]